MSKSKRNLLNEAFSQSKGGWKAGQKGIIASKTRWQGPQSSHKNRLRQSFRSEAGGLSITGGMVSPFGNKKFVLAVFILTIVIGGAIFANLVLRTYETIPNVGASQTIWDSSNFPNSAGEFAFSNAAYVATCVGTTNCIKLKANSTSPGIALDRQSISLDTISGHEVSFRNDWCFASTPSGLQNIRWGFYLTRNATLPTQAGYSPRNDASVALMLETQDTGNGNINAYNWVQRAATQTIASGDTSGGVEGIGTLFLTLGTTQDTGVCNVGGNHNTIIDELMNFTGSGSPTNPSVSTLYESTPGSASNNQAQLSWLSFQSVPYYVGIFQEACASCNNIDILGNEAIIRFDPASAGTYTLTPQTPDAGFFGPLIRALIPIGVFILNAIMSFVGFLLPAITAAFNVIGGFFGLPGLGTQIINFFSAVAGWFSNVFGTAFAQAANILTFIVNGITLFTVVGSNFFNGASQALSALINMLGFLQPIMSLIILSAHMSISTLVVLWLFVGMLQAFKSFEAFMGWFRTTEMLFLKVFKFIYWISDEVFKLVARLRTTAPRPAGI